MKRQVAVSIVAILTAVACSRQQWGFPRMAVRAASPDGRFLAFVRNHPTVDPPDQSLWLQATEGQATRVALVPPDALWCDRIAWSADSRRVAFVIADAIVQVYDAPTRTRAFSGFVGRRSWDTPPSYVLRDVSLSTDGRAITFRECERTWRPVEAARQNPRGSRVESSIGNCSAVPQTVEFTAVAKSSLW